jgi:aspartyl-tRNA(Asn)/glutamyl-tRNA(Gln) amidotransferase subunit A
MTWPDSITAAASALAAGEVSSVDLVRHCLEVADRTDGALGAFAGRFDMPALAAAAEADARRRRGEPLGPLDGIPVGVKDILTTREGPTRAQSLVPSPVPVDAEADAVCRLRAAGSVIVGKLATMEYAVGLPDETKPFPVPVNPVDPTRWAGGSSSGSASAVAVGAVLGAVGTDTAASIRMPAAHCGITGLKPTYDLVSRGGCLPLASTLDHVGPMARTAADCALLLEAMTGTHVALRGVAGLRIGYDGLASVGPRDPAVDPAFDTAVGAFEALGAELVPVKLPAYDAMTAAAQVILHAEAFAVHRASLASYWADYGRNTRRRLSLGALIPAVDYVDALRVRRAGIAAVARSFGQFDLVITPTTGGPAPTIAALRDADVTIGSGTPLYTAYWNAAGNPAVSVPMGTVRGLPLGLQIVGRWHDEASVLSAAAALVVAG